MNQLTQAMILVIYAGIIFTLVRPGSKGPQLIGALGSSISGIIGAGMGNGSNWNGGK